MWGRKLVSKIILKVLPCLGVGTGLGILKKEKHSECLELDRGV